jgi:hypothetical protein
MATYDGPGNNPDKANAIGLNGMVMYLSLAAVTSIN